MINKIENITHRRIFVDNCVDNYAFSFKKVRSARTQKRQELARPIIQAC